MLSSELASAQERNGIGKQEDWLVTDFSRGKCDLLRGLIRASSKNADGACAGFRACDDDDIARCDGVRRDDAAHGLDCAQQEGCSLLVTLGRLICWRWLLSQEGKRRMKQKERGEVRSCEAHGASGFRSTDRSGEDGGTRQNGPAGRLAGWATVYRMGTGMSNQL